MAAGDATTVLAGAGTAWTGAAALKGGKGYAACPMGQAHYRSVGAGGTPFLLLHQTPLSIAEYVDVQPALARAGRRSITIDNPGYGLSDPPDGSPDMAAFADNLVPLLDQLEVAKVIVVGHHTGASIAAAFAARHPDRTAGVVLHGCPLYTQAEREERLSHRAAPPVLKADGSHLSQRFHDITDRTGTESQNLVSATWAVLGSYLTETDSKIYPAVFKNDMQRDIAAIRAPGMVLSDAADTLHGQDRKVAALRPDFTYRQFSEGRSYALMHEPERWAGLILAFAKAHGI